MQVGYLKYFSKPILFYYTTKKTILTMLVWLYINLSMIIEFCSLENGEIFTNFVSV